MRRMLTREEQNLKALTTVAIDQKNVCMVINKRLNMLKSKLFICICSLLLLAIGL